MAVTLEDLHATAKQHSDRIRTIETAITSFEKVAEQTERNRKEIFGNGTPGQDERIRIEERISVRHEAEIKELRVFIEGIKPLVVFAKVGVWFGGLIGVSVVALIWSLITGQASVSFP